MNTLKKIWHLFKCFVPHLMIVLSFILITLLVTDQFNRAMNFINNNITKGGLLVFAILAVFQSVLHIIHNRKQ